MAAVLLVVVCSGVAVANFSQMRTLSKENQTRQLMIKTIDGAYQGWLTNDDQANTYAAIMALRDPAQHDLAETTFAQSKDGYDSAVADLARRSG